MEINKKYARTTQTQLETYITFIDEHPEFLTGKNSPDAPKRLEELWDALTGWLNAQIGPTKTAGAWKGNLRNWRKQLKCKARKVRAEIQRTGGGVSNATGLTDFEDRALQSLGSGTITGLNGVDLGFGSESVTTQPIIGRLSPIEIIKQVTITSVTESTPPPLSPLFLLAHVPTLTLNTPSPYSTSPSPVARTAASPTARTAASRTAAAPTRRRHKKTPNGLEEYLKQEAVFRREELQLKREQMEMQRMQHL